MAGREYPDPKIESASNRYFAGSIPVPTSTSRVYLRWFFASKPQHRRFGPVHQPTLPLNWNWLAMFWVK